MFGEVKWTEKYDPSSCWKSVNVISLIPDIPGIPDKCAIKILGASAVSLRTFDRNHCSNHCKLCHHNKLH